MELFLQLLLNGIIIGSLYAIMALGFGLIFNTSRIFHLAHGGVFTWGAYIGYTLYMVVGTPFWVATIGAILCCTVLGVAIELAIYRPLRHRHVSPMVVMLASLGVLTVLNNVAAIVWGTYTLKMRHGMANTIYLGNITATDIGLITVAVFIPLFIGLLVFLNRTKIGVAMRGVASNPTMSQVVGISLDGVMVVSMAVGSAAAGVAAVLLCVDTGIVPFGGFIIVLMACLALIIGGVGSITGAALGGLFVGLVRSLGPFIFPSVWQEFVLFAVLIVLMIFLPRGFLGKKIWRADI